MRKSVMKWLPSKVVFILVLTCSFILVAQNSYKKCNSWEKTITVNHNLYWQAVDSGTIFSFSQGPWYHSGAYQAPSFSTPGFLIIGFDNGKFNPNATFNNKKVWRKESYEDGMPHDLPGLKNRKGGSCANYLYREIIASQDGIVEVGLGTDDGYTLWLNGKKVAEHNVSRGVTVDEERLKLKLKKGINGFLLKVHNKRGGHGFSYSTKVSNSEKIVTKICKWFPKETKEIQGFIVEYFNHRDDCKWLQKTIASTIAKAEYSGKYKKQLEKLVVAKTPYEDTKWLSLQAEATKFLLYNKKIKDIIKNVNLPAMKRSVLHLKSKYKEQYKNADFYLRKIADYEKNLKEMKRIAMTPEKDKATINSSITQQQAMKYLAELIEFRKKMLLDNPALKDFDKIYLIKRSHKREGLPANWQGNCSMSRTGYNNEIDILDFKTKDAPLTTLYRPKRDVFVGDFDINFDADKMLFSSIGTNNRWHIFEMNTDGTGLHQLTSKSWTDIDSYDACYLPNGKIIFDCTLGFQGVPCVSGSDYVANLCLMNTDGTGLRRLTYEQDHDWCPTVMNDGKVMYTRWEYTDSAHYFSRIVMNMNPDGTAQKEHYGSNSYWPNSVFYARPIPNHSTKFVGIVTGHHGVKRVGEMVIFDPQKGRHEADGAIQKIGQWGKKVKAVTKDRLADGVFPRFLHPYPLNEEYYLVACQQTPKSNWGIYLVDTFDNMLLLKEEPRYMLLEPVPFKKTKRPPIIPDRTRPDSKDAILYVQDIYQGPGLRGVPRGTVKKLRVFQYEYAYRNTGSHQAIGMEGPWDVHRLLGTVDVNEDGSAMFTIPANVPIALQPLNENGEALQIMRSWLTAMPGEVLSCVGCHEMQGTTPPTALSAAAKKAPTKLKPWRGKTRGFSFKREVQPVLDKYCVGCHRTNSPKKTRLGETIPDFSSTAKDWGGFTKSYLALHPYVRRNGPEGVYYVLTPLEFNVNTSELIQMLKKGHHNVKLDKEAWDRLYTWIDLNVPDHGTWHEYRQNRGVTFAPRREAMRKKYSGVDYDPEYIPNTYPKKLPFVMPKKSPTPNYKPQKITNWPFNKTVAKAKQGKNTKKIITIADGVTMTLTKIPAGEFIMGNNQGEMDEKPASKVKITKSFWMGTMEVSLKQYQQFDPNYKNGFYDMHHKDQVKPGYSMDNPDFPVIRVSWNKAMEFCKWLSKKTGKKITLPTEAQWEWACRAGTNTTTSYGSWNDIFSNYANLSDISMKKAAVHGVNPRPIRNPSKYYAFVPADYRSNDHVLHLAKVASYAPNNWGLYDMHGNVCEWTRSLYKKYPYNDADGRNSLSKNGNRVIRGGSWRDRPWRARSAFRLDFPQWQQVYNVGFRIILEED